MAYDFQEQEQIDDIKAFWRRYGGFILTVVTVVALSFAGWRLWGWYQMNQAAAAGNAYKVLVEAAQAKDLSRVRAAAGTLLDSHGGSLYAPLGALVSARAHFEANELDAARQPLEWIVREHPESDIAPIARLRLAGVLLDQGKAAEGLALLEGDAPAAFAGPWADRRGDLLAALDRREDAIAAWEDAYARLEAEPALRRLVKLKLDAMKAQTA